MESSSSSGHLQSEADGVLHLTSWGWTRGGTSVRKEPNKERKVGLIGCRRRNLVVSICHSVARETRPRCLGPPRASLSFALSPFFLALSTPGSASSSFSTRFDSRGIYLWIRRSRRSAWTLAGYYENSEAPSNLPGIRSTYPGGRAKNPTTAADPLLVGAHPCTYIRELSRLGFERYDRLTIENLTRNSM